MYKAALRLRNVNEDISTKIFSFKQYLEILGKNKGCHK